MSEPRSDKTAWVVLGMHRSGTSAMAGVLSLCGARLPADLLPPSPANVAGYYESKPITELNDEILASSDAEWDDIFAGQPRPYLSNFDVFFHQKAMETLSAEYRDLDSIVLKDPRINSLAPLWDRVLRSSGYDPFYVIMVRHPLEVAQSLRERDGFSLEKSLLLWLDQMTAVERDTRSLNRIFVSFDDMLSTCSRVLDRIEAKATVPLPRRTAAASNAVGRYLSTRMRHHSTTDAGAAATLPIWTQVAETYAWFVEACKAETEPKAEPLVSARDRLREAYVTFGPILADQHLKVTEARLETSDFRQHVGNLERERGLLERALVEAAARGEETSAQCASLEGRLAGNERLAASLEEGKSKLERALGEALARADDADAQREQADQHSSELEHRAAQLIAERTREAAALAEVEGELAQRSGETDTLQAELAATRDEVDRVRNELAALEQTSATLTAEAGDRACRLAESEAELQSAEAVRYALAAELEAMREEIDRIRDEREALQQAFAALSEEAGDRSRRLAEAEAERQSTAQAYDTLQSRYEQAREDAMTAQAGAEAALAARHDVETGLEDREREIARLELALSQAAQSQGDFSEAVRQDGLRRENAEARDWRSARAEPTSADVDTGALESEVRAIEAKERLLEARYEEVRAENLRLQAGSEAAAAAQSALQAELEEQRRRHDELERETGGVHGSGVIGAAPASNDDRLTELEEDRSAAQDARERVEARYVEVRAENFRLQALSEEGAASRNALERELSKLRSQLSGAERILAELDAERERSGRAAEDAAAMKIEGSLTLVRLRQIEHSRDLLSERLAELKHERDAVLSSTAWRLTALPRRVVSFVRGRG